MDKSEVVNKVAREEGLNAPNFMVLYAYDVNSMHHLLEVLEEFCHSSECGENKDDGNANHPTPSLPYAHI